MAPKLKIPTPDHLIATSLLLFAAKGFKATTVQDIAKRAKVNVSLISYYFKGKEGLFRACVNRSGSKRLEVARDILVAPKTMDEFKVRLQLFTDEMLTYHVENPAVCTILHRDLHSEMELLGDIFEETILKAFQTFVDFISSAKEQGFLASWVNPLMTSSNYYGVLFHSAKHQDLGKKYYGKTIAEKAYREEVRDYLIRTTLEGIQK